MASDALHRPVYTVGDTAVAITLHEPATAVPEVPEALIQHLWAEQRFDTSALTTTRNRPIAVLDPGTLNTDSGADFRDAHLRIGTMEWRGDVELHHASGGWFEHEHHLDPRYNSVILHVTLAPDKWTGGLLRADQSRIPELVLLPHLQQGLRTLLRSYRTNEASPILCAPHWNRVAPEIRHEWITHLGRERLAQKKERLARRYATQPDLEHLLYERLFAGLGYAKNDTAMEDLARRLPLSFVRDFSDPQDLEALYLGTAGLIPRPGDLLGTDRATADYAMDLRARFRRLHGRHDLAQMDRTRWTFFRLRPANFPPLRIAQGVAWLQLDDLLHHDPIGRLVEAIRAETPVNALRDAVRATPGAFWNDHLRLEKPTSPQNPQVGRARADTLIINAVLPALLFFAEQNDRPELRGRVFALFARLPARQDAVTRPFASLGTRPGSALEAQGLHRLYRDYCSAGRCLSCAIGKRVLDGA